MIVLVTGTSGFIGSRLAKRLAGHGHFVVAAVRDVARVQRRTPQIRSIRTDFVHATTLAAWRAHVTGVDAVVVRTGAPPSLAPALVFIGTALDVALGVLVFALLHELEERK